MLRHTFRAQLLHSNGHYGRHGHGRGTHPSCTAYCSFPCPFPSIDTFPLITSFYKVGSIGERLCAIEHPDVKAADRRENHLATSGLVRALPKGQQNTQSVARGASRCVTQLTSQPSRTSPLMGISCWRLRLQRCSLPKSVSKNSTHFSESKRETLGQGTRFDRFDLVLIHLIKFLFSSIFIIFLMRTFARATRSAC